VTRETSMKFHDQNLANLNNLRVKKEIKAELYAILTQLKSAALKLGEFQDAHPHVDLVSAGSHLCPHCGSQLTKVGWGTCSSCSKDIAWAKTPPLRHAGTRLPNGHVYQSELVGACKPEHLDDLGEYYRLRAVTAQLERDYVIKQLSNERKAGCFIATACFGDENHPTVIALRLFRDEKLSQSKLGNTFIDWYYRNGPHLAKIVNVFPFLGSPLRLLLRCSAWLLGSMRVK